MCTSASKAAGSPRFARWSVNSSMCKPSFSRVTCQLDEEKAYFVPDTGMIDEKNRCVNACGARAQKGIVMEKIGVGLTKKERVL